MSERNILLRLCEQACNDREWLAALKLISLFVSSDRHPHAHNNLNNNNNDVSSDQSTRNGNERGGSTITENIQLQQLIVFILNNIEEDADFFPAPDTQDHKILQLFHLIYGGNTEILLSLSKLYFNFGEEQYTNALETAQEAVIKDPYNATALETFENICCHMIDRWHFSMLNDFSRNKAYDSALHEVMRQHHRHVNIVDVGCGTGLLSFLAAKWSNKVYGVERSSLMCKIARNTLESCHLDEEILDKITIINKMSTDLSISIDIPTKVDVLVTEIFDAGLFGEGILSTLTHAWKKLLKTDANETKSVVIPNKATLYVEGIESEDLRKESTFDRWKYGLTTGNLHITSNVGMLESDPYTSVHLDILPSGFKSLIPSKEFLHVDFNDTKSIFDMNKGLSGSVVLDVTEEGTLDALSVWFKLHLTDSIEVSTQSGTGGCWEQAVFPVSCVKLIERPSSCDNSHPQRMKVCPGDKVSVVYNVRDDRLSMCVTTVHRQTTQSLVIDKPPSFPAPNELPSNPLAWCPHDVYCLSDWEIRALNDRLYQGKLLESLKRLPLVVNKKETASISQFSHINNGFSPLCLEALSLGFQQVQTLTPTDSDKALLWKLVQLNKLDIKKIKTIDDVSELPEDPFISEETESSAQQLTEERSGRAVVVFDVVDNTGRLVENWNDKLGSIKEYLGNFSTTHILPERVDIWGILIESDSLLRRNRVVSNENVISYPVKDHINRYATMNHPDLCLSTLKHRKLTSSFKIFSLNLTEEVNKDRSTKCQPNELNPDTGDACEQGVTHCDEEDKNSTDKNSLTNQTISLKIPAIAQGKLDAIVYWFDLHLSPFHSVSTLDPSSCWPQASIVLDSATKTSEGQELHLKFRLQNSTIFVTELE